MSKRSQTEMNNIALDSFITDINKLYTYEKINHLIPVHCRNNNS